MVKRLNSALNIRMRSSSELLTIRFVTVSPGLGQDAASVGGVGQAIGLAEEVKSIDGSMEAWPVRNAQPCSSRMGIHHGHADDRLQLFECADNDRAIGPRDRQEDT